MNCFFFLEKSGKIFLRFDLQKEKKTLSNTLKIYWKNLSITGYRFKKLRFIDFNCQCCFSSEKFIAPITAQTLVHEAILMMRMCRRANVSAKKKRNDF